PAAVPEIVDEDPTLAPALRHLGEIAVRLLGGEDARHRFGEALHLVPSVAWGERHHHVQTLAAARHDERLELYLFQAVAHLLGRLFDLPEIEILVRIEIEDDAVGFLEGVDM